MRNKFQIYSNKQKKTGDWKQAFVKNKNPQGFTLIEMIIYGGMLAVLLGVFTTIFGMIIDVQLESDATSTVQQDGQYILAKLSQDITKADSITTPATLGQSGSSLQLVRNSVTYTYALDGNSNLSVTTNAGSNHLNSYRTSLSNLQFTKRGNTGGKGSIQFSYTITSTTLQGVRLESAVVSSSATLR
jgi:type II secretory pathway pseudopilin PulG